MKVWKKHQKVWSAGRDAGRDAGKDDGDINFFWYYDEGECWVDPDIVNIPSIDKVNSVLWRGDRWVSTEVFSTMPSYTIEEYHQKFCKLDVVSGKWIYKR